MSVSDRKKGNICILELSGQLKLGAAVDRFAERFDELLKSGERHFVFDMLKVPWLDTSGINTTVACHKHLRDLENGGEIKIVLRGKGHSLFEFYELHKLFDLYEDVESALAAFAVEA